MGCGVGNTAFPLLELNPTVQVYACDFAASAIKLLRQHPEYAASGRCAAFVADITGGWRGVGRGVGASRSADEAGTGFGSPLGEM